MLNDSDFQFTAILCGNVKVNVRLTLLSDLVTVGVMVLVFSTFVINIW